MANYCKDCKFAGKKSGPNYYCNKHQTLMDQYASCTDYIWYKSHHPMTSFYTWLITILHLLS